MWGGNPKRRPPYRTIPGSGAFKTSGAVQGAGDLVGAAQVLDDPSLSTSAPSSLSGFWTYILPLDSGGLQQWGLFCWVAAPIVALRLRRDRAARWLALAWLLHLGLYTYVLAAARPGDLDALLGVTASRLLLHTIAWPLLIVLRPLGNEPTAAAVARPCADPASP